MTYTQPQILPSILSADFTQLGEQIKEIEAADIKTLHIDVMDGRFVPNITMGPLVVEAINRVTNMHLDVHLMIVEPERYVDAFAKAGADTITVHLEASPNLHRTLQNIKEAGCRAGVAINPHSPAVLLQEVMPILDVANVMTVNPGFGGQKFLPHTMAKIADIKAMAGTMKRQIDVEVDGGINAETISAAVQSGANLLVVGTGVFGHEDGITAGIKAMRAAMADDDE